MCDDAAGRLVIPSKVLRVAVEAVDVDVHPDLLAEFGARVPVVMGPDETVLAEGRLTRRDAWRATWRARRG